MRFVYTLLFYLLLPFLVLRLLWRSVKQPSYRQRIGERLGYLPFKLEKCIWLHAVSVGETLAAIPMIKNLLAQYPHLPVVVTTMTPTGAERVKDAFGEKVMHFYIPYDLPSAVTRFLDSLQPLIGIIIETELWPNLLAACKKQNIPIGLVNARLSEKSASGYCRIAPMTRSMLQSFNFIAAHASKDATRFIDLGAPKSQVVVTGNIKFDLDIPAPVIVQSEALRTALGKQRFVWLAASTHEGEEEIILRAHHKLRKKLPDALLILVPRHPDRFNQVAKLVQSSFEMVRRSQAPLCAPETAVYLGDTMGELLLMYGACDVCFVGGSLIARGGHNILEPGALGKPILTGPHLFNFAEISEMFLEEDALKIIHNSDQLADSVSSMALDVETRFAMGERAKNLVAKNRGALDKQMQLIDQTLIAAQG